MTTKTDTQLEREEFWKSNGFNLIDEIQPAIGDTVEAIRVLHERDENGVIYDTDYATVVMSRESEGSYRDDLNCEPALDRTDFEAWRSLPTEGSIAVTWNDR